MQEIDPAADQLDDDGPPARQSAQPRPSPAPALDDLAALHVPPMRADDTCVVMWESEPTRAFHTWVNPHAEQLLGFPRHRWQTEPDFWAERLHPQDRDRTHKAFHQALEAHGHCRQTYRLLHADGSVRWVEEHVKTVDYPASEDGLAPQRLRGTMIDVTDYHQEINALERSRAYYRSLFEDAPAIYFVLDEHGIVRRINQHGADQLSYTPSQLIGQHFVQLQAGEDVIDITRLILESDAHSSEWHNTTLRCADKRLLPVRLRTMRAEATQMLEDAPLPAPALLVSCEPLPSVATTAPNDTDSAADALTGLAKRAQFERHLQHLLYRHYEQPGEHVLAVIDIDQFGLANYRFGQSAGDALLREVAEILQDHMRRGDLIGRTGSDEFAVILERCPMRQAKVLCEGAIDAISQHDFEWADHSVRLTASAGLVKIDANLQSVSELMSAADAARREASAQSLSGIRLIDPAATPSVHRNSDVALAAELQNALEDGRLELFYQPIRQLYDSTGHPCATSEGPPAHYELLLRVRRNQLLMSPQQILLAAERHHLIGEVDRWVLTEATRWLDRRPEHVVAREMCCINVSAKSICDRQFIDFARSRLRALGDRASSICFEITETAIIGNLDDAVTGMERLRATGCDFSLDDFGSGSASFPYLRKLPVSYLKIDGSFVREAGASDDDARFLELINQIGHHAGKQTVAEFVENEHTLCRVRDIGLDFAQGYEIGRPRPLEHFGIAVTASPPVVASHSATITPFPNVRSV